MHGVIFYLITFRSMKTAHESLYRAIARPFKWTCDRNPSYFQFVKNHATYRVNRTKDRKKEYQ